MDRPYLAPDSQTSEPAPGIWQQLKVPFPVGLTLGAGACVLTRRNADIWEHTVHKAWEPSVQETADGYFKDARRSFGNGQCLEGAETLADAVGATLGHIASARSWSHATHGPSTLVSDNLQYALSS